jgi:farnesyl-diphosphate farnesyltransferase
MSRSDLGGPLLAAVSRSFYLTIRILPRGLQEPIGLAYLLARASDTIADSSDAPVALRLEHLAGFAAMVRERNTRELPALQRDIRAEDAGEAELIARLGECLAWLRELDERDQAEIASVMEKIIHGQTLDLQRFAVPAEVIALQSAGELEEYTYLVAGCVGEFWTRICLLHDRQYSRTDPAELHRLGANFGKGLQLVNILRDLPADLRSGRCYLPEDELQATGATPADLLAKPETAQVVLDCWHARAAELLRDGESYIAALRPIRLRIGCFLPCYLGVKTLALLAEKSPLLQPTKLKVPRSTVRAAFAWASLIAFSNRALTRCFARARR